MDFNPAEITFLVLFPVVAFAQSHQGMPPNMKMNMEQMQKAMVCMESLDQSVFKRLEEEKG